MIVLKKFIILLCVLLLLVGCQNSSSDANNEINSDIVSEEKDNLSNTNQDQSHKDKESTQKKQEEKKSFDAKSKDSASNTDKPQSDKDSESVSKKTEEEKSTETVKKDNSQGEVQVKEFIMVIGNKELKVNLSDNDAVSSLLNRMPLTLKMDELNGNEKYNYLNFTLPTHSENIRNIKAGDLLLFGNNCLVLFYEDYTTSYQYTRIGRVQNTGDIKGLVGKGSIDITFKTN